MKTAIIPSKPLFFGQEDELDLKAITVFSATGFFLDRDTYFQGLKTVPVASEVKISNSDIQAVPYFQWHYNPRDITFEQALEEFTDLFESIFWEQIQGKKVILPLSGGLDSRTQAAALRQLGADVQSYSYSFEGGLDETRYGKAIAKACQFPFTKLTVPHGYLWDCIDELAMINGCYSEFTHPRQMAFLDQYASMGEVFSLGHWGDVFFDDMGVPEDLDFEGQVDVVLKKILKKGGLELGTALWQSWGIQGNFKDYLRTRVAELLQQIDIPHSANARIRAFKSLYWATRWTSVNLSVFETVRPITLPYYDNRMCEWICTVPEKYLAGRQLQIAYLKKRAPQLAKITWQDHRPFNLYQYHWNKAPYNLPYRAYQKLKRSLSNRKYIQRNWELQFLGNDNARHLENRLLEESRLLTLIPKDLIESFYQKFKEEDAVTYSHPVSMLLTLSLFSKHYLK